MLRSPASGAEPGLTTSQETDIEPMPGQLVRHGPSDASRCSCDEGYLPGGHGALSRVMDWSGSEPTSSRALFDPLAQEAVEQMQVVRRPRHGAHGDHRCGDCRGGDAAGDESGRYPLVQTKGAGKELADGEP